MTEKDKEAVVIIIRGIASGLMLVGIAGLVANAGAVSLAVFGAGLFLVAIQARINGDK